MPETPTHTPKTPYYIPDPDTEGWYVGMGVMADAQLGPDDRGTYCLMFTVHMANSLAFSTGIYTPEDIIAVLSDNGAKTPTDLNGKTCWYETDGSMSHFLYSTGIKVK